MNTPSFRARLAALAAAAAILLAACGGGGSSMPATATASATSVVTTGVVTGFGSIYVNGVRYDTSGAQFDIDGRPGTQAELKVGDVVQLKGRRGGNTASAERIVHRNSVQGPIAAVDSTANRLTVLGQTVLVSASTSFDDSISPAGIAGLAVGDVIEVSGLPNSSGQIEATRIEPAAAGATWEVVGRIAASDGTRKQFELNELVVAYGSATLDDFGAGGPKDGDVVEVKGATLGAAGELIATRVEFLGNKDMRPDGASGEVEIEGFVTRYVSATDFDVTNRPVTTNGSTVYRGGTAADLKADARVEVEGSLDAAGVLVAAKVEFKRRANVRVEAAIESIDATANSFKVLGIEVSVDASTRVEDKSGNGSQFFKFADLRAGDVVAVRGLESPAGSGKMLALRLERMKELRETRLRGPVKRIERPNFTILTAVVTTTDATRFERDEDLDLTADEFFGLTDLVGTSVDVRGTQNGTVYTATRVEVSGEDD